MHMKKTESERQIRGERRYQCPSCITSFWSEVHRKPHDIHLCTKISIDMQGIFFRLQFVCIFFFKQVAVSIEIVQRTQYCIAFSHFECVIRAFVAQGGCGCFFGLLACFSFECESLDHFHFLLHPDFTFTGQC